MDIQTKTDIIHQKIYDFLLYIYPLLTKYPKYEKFSLQTATRNAILEMLQEVIKWDKTATKSHLYTVDTALQESKELLRLAHDLKYSAMNARHYGESCRKLKEIGVMLGELIYEWNKYHPDQPLYAIKADIHHYFQSIDHAVLKTEIRKVIKDAGVLALLDRIIDHNGNMPDGVGIPVGNLTSQLFANIYLDALDQFIKHELGVEAYIRYMDDFVILSPDKEQLRSWLARIEQFLREELKLEFNQKTTILAAKNGIDFVGYKHRATHRKVRKDSIKRIKRTIKKCESGKITKEQLQKSIQSWTGHAGHADSYNLRKKIETLAEAAIEKAA